MLIYLLHPCMAYHPHFPDFSNQLKNRGGWHNKSKYEIFLISKGFFCTHPAFSARYRKVGNWYNKIKSPLDNLNNVYIFWCFFNFRVCLFQLPGAWKLPTLVTKAFELGSIIVAVAGVRKAKMETKVWIQERTEHFEDEQLPDSWVMNEAMTVYVSKRSESLMTLTLPIPRSEIRSVTW